MKNLPRLYASPVCIGRLHRWPQIGYKRAGSRLMMASRSVHPSGILRGILKMKIFLKRHHDAIEREMPKSGGWMVKLSLPIPTGPDFEAAARRLIVKRNAKYALWGNRRRTAS